MSIVDELIKGFLFRVCGKIGDTMSFTSKDGETMRFVRIVSVGKTHNLEVETDEELARFDLYRGKWCRAGGVLGRRRGSAAATAKVSEIQIEGQPGWKELTEREIVESGRFAGVGLVAQKRSGVYSGQSYRKYQVNSFGETFEFRDVDPVLFETLPEQGPVRLQGHWETLLTSGHDGKVSDMILVLDAVTPEASSPGPGRPARQASEGQADAKPA